MPVLANARGRLATAGSMSGTASASAAAIGATEQEAQLGDLIAGWVVEAVGGGWVVEKVEDGLAVRRTTEQEAQVGDLILGWVVWNG